MPRLILVTGPVCLLVAFALLAAPVPETAKPSAPPPILFDDATEPTLAVLEQRFADVEREIQRLRTAKQTADADTMQGELDQFKSRLQGKYRPPLTKDPEVHVVGFYQGSKPPAGKVGFAQVDVTYTGKPIVLVLCAYDPTGWGLDVGKDVEIKQVIRAGYHDQEVAGVPAGTPVSHRIHDRASPEHFFAYRRDSDHFRRMKEAVERITGATLTTFQGGYAYKDRPVVVGPDNGDWRTEHILWDMRSLHERATGFEREQLWNQLKGLKFRAVHTVFPEGQRGGKLASSLGDFTPAGPVADTLRPLAGPALQLAADPAGQIDYVFAGGGGAKVATVDRKSGELSEIKVTDVPEVSHPSAAAFDSKRGRLLLTSFGGGGMLYAYEPKEKKWSVLAKPGLGVRALTYDATDDVFYGVKFPDHERAALTVIGRYGPQGALLNDITLSPTIPVGQYAQFEGNIQIVSVEKKLVVLVYSSADHEGKQKVAPPRSYVIDPKSGKVIFACDLTPQ